MQGTLAVVSQAGRSVSFFDLETWERVAHLDNLIAEPHELALDTKRNLLYVSHTYRIGSFWVHGEQAHEISIIDLAKREVVGVIDTSPAMGPHGLAIDSTKDVLWVGVEHVSSDAAGGMVAMDLNSHKITKRVESGSKAHWFAITPDGKKAYTCHKTAKFNSVLDLENERILSRINVPGSEETCASPDGRYFYQPIPGLQFGAIPPDTSVLVIDTATDKVAASIKLDYAPQTTHVTSKGMLMVGLSRFEQDAKSPDTYKPGPGLLAVYDCETRKLLGQVETGIAPLTMRSSPDGSIGFTANNLGGTVSVVDLTSMKLIKTLIVDTNVWPGQKCCLGAHGMAYIP